MIPYCLALTMAFFVNCFKFTGDGKDENGSRVRYSLDDDGGKVGWGWMFPCAA